REQDVVVGPIGVVGEFQPRVVGADAVELIAADEDLIVQSCVIEGFERAIENAPPADGGVGLGLILGHRFEPAAATGADDDRSHVWQLLGWDAVGGVADPATASATPSTVVFGTA